MSDETELTVEQWVRVIERRAMLDDLKDTTRLACARLQLGYGALRRGVRYLPQIARLTIPARIR
jgi:hypothetical protein